MKVTNSTFFMCVVSSGGGIYIYIYIYNIWDVFLNAVGSFSPICKMEDLDHFPWRVMTFRVMIKIVSND